MQVRNVRAELCFPDCHKSHQPEKVSGMRIHEARSDKLPVNRQLILLLFEVMSDKRGFQNASLYCRHKRLQS